MAAPPEVTIENLSGVYDLNKTLSDNSANMLKMQNVGFIIRQAIAYSAVEYTLRSYTDDAGIAHLHIVQVSTGNQRNEEEWHLTGVTADVDNRIWGKVQARSQYATLADLPDDFLKEGWLSTEKFITSDVKSVTDTWTAFQVLGFAEINGERRHVRRVVGKKGDKVEKIRLVYDYKSPVPAEA